MHHPDTEFVLKGAPFNLSRRVGIPSEGRHGDSQGSDTCMGAVFSMASLWCRGNIPGDIKQK